MTRYFFAPGPVPMEETIKIDWSHRSPQFSKIFLDTKDMLEEMVGMRVAIIQGSASAAIESVLEGLGLVPKRVLVLNNGAFAQRVVDRLNRQGFSVKEAKTVEEAIAELEGNDSPEAYFHAVYAAVYAVQFETSNSIYNDLQGLSRICKTNELLFIVDAVSAFPFYCPPEADVLVLSSSKQLRGLPVLGIVAYRDEMELRFEKTGGYLCLKKAIEYGKSGQTPHTSLIPQVLSLWDSLKCKSWKPYVRRIKDNAKILTQGLEEMVIGEKVAPVITLEMRQVDIALQHLQKRGLDVYYNATYSGHRIQVSCFNYKEAAPYVQLNDALDELEN